MENETLSSHKQEAALTRLAILFHVKISDKSQGLQFICISCIWLEAWWYVQPAVHTLPCTSVICTALHLKGPTFRPTANAF